ncbi:MAG: hypothetical protein EA408_06310 [Marinilabiliales bacterium]|nr:MAG: hypothetical protein EA408_06310 [Marinilabiliales bacterium]
MDNKTRILFSAFLFFILFAGPAGASQTDTVNYTDSDGYRQGYWEQRYSNNNLRYTGWFVDDRPSGEFTRYFPTGNVMAVMNFCEDGVRAEAELYYDNGNLAARGLYVNEKKDSVWKYFSYYEKHLASVETYNHGVKEGLSAVYLPNGNISESFKFSNDKRNGPWIQYYSNGNVKSRSEFADDMRHGDFVLYSPGGRKEIAGSYKRNRMHGEWIFYNERGEVISSVIYVNGVAENEGEMIEALQEEFKQIEEMRGKIPEPDESDLFNPGRR